MKVYLKKELCCGCTTCKLVCPTNAIEMKRDKEGFQYPVIDMSKCIGCGLCMKSCQYYDKFSDQQEFPKKILAAKSANKSLQENSASGGIFAVLAESFINEGGRVYGVVYDKKLRANHEKADKINECEKFYGSKYQQSNLRDSYISVKKDLSENRKVLFSGTPCQIVGLNKFLINTDRHQLTTIDLVCHGVPSPKLFREYIRFCERKKRKKIVNFVCRAKEIPYGRGSKIQYSDGKEDYKSYLSKIWMQLYGMNIILRPSCYVCKYSNYNRVGDITLGDFWGIEKTMPRFVDENGVSLVSINTTKGNEVFKQIESKVITKESTMKASMQYNLHSSTKRNKNSTQFWNDYQKKGFVFVVKRYCKYSLWMQMKQYWANKGE